MSWLALAARGISLEDMKSSTSCRHLSEAEPGRTGKVWEEVCPNKNEDDCEGNEDSTVANAQMCRRLRGALLCTIFLGPIQVEMTSAFDFACMQQQQPRTRGKKVATTAPAGAPAGALILRSQVSGIEAQPDTTGLDGTLPLSHCWGINLVLRQVSAYIYLFQK